MLLCGVSRRADRDVLYVKHVIVAKDGTDYVRRGFRFQLGARFVAETAGRAADHGLGWVAVHNHFGGGAVAFSSVDLASHERGYPALVQLTGAPVGALVINADCVAGDIWTGRDRQPVKSVRIVGGVQQARHPAPLHEAETAGDRFDRQARLIGDRGVGLLRRLRVGLVGAGGAGSQICQGVAKLGVGRLLAIDPDVVECSNLPRIVGATNEDIGEPKVDVAKRVAEAADTEIAFTGLRANVTDPSVAGQLAECDAIFLAADSMQARHVVNAICTQYLLPGFQVGAKATVTEGSLDDVFVVSRRIGPDALCMWCAGLICATTLQEESYSDHERRAMAYVDGVPQPSVFSLNALATSFALNDFLFSFTGIAAEDTRAFWFDALNREPMMERRRSGRETCRECGPATASRYGRGDLARLPVELLEVE